MIISFINFAQSQRNKTDWIIITKTHALPVILPSGVAPGFARRGAGFPYRGLNIRIVDIFLCIVTQFSVKNSPADTKFFPDGGGGG